MQHTPLTLTPPHPTFLTRHDHSCSVLRGVSASGVHYSLLFNIFITPSFSLSLSVHLFLFVCVSVRPSKPRCSIEGSPYVGNDVVLRCKSTDGTSPIQYAWVKTSDSKLLPANAVLGKG